MIKIYGPKENNFTSNGIVAFKPFKLVETKKISLNGWYIDVAAPLQYEEHLKQDMLCVVKVKSKLKPQAFRIKDVKKTQRKIEFQAEHVIFDARNYFLLDVRAVNMSAVGALKYINERTDNKSPFSFTSDVNNSSTAYFIRKNLLEAMVTIEERWGGYFEADNWSVVLKKSIGKDRGEVISYGKNLESIQVVEDWSNVVTKLYPVGFDGILLPEKYLESEVKYDQPYTKTVQFETEFEDEDRTEANLLPELRENAQAYIEKNQYPMVNYEIKSNINELMEIGDLIHVKHPLVDIQTTVQEYQYDILQNRVTSLVFGNYSRDVKKRFDSIKNDIKELKQNTSNVEAIIGNQTELINSLNKDGHIYIDDNQIMVLDKLPKENAKYVWRWNMGGLGFSENGVEGPFKQAWTIDGTFNTDFIAANSIMANQLHSDVGSSLDISSNQSIKLLSNTVDSQGQKISEAQIQIDGVQGNVNINANSIKNKIDKGKAAQDINTGTVAINANRITLNGHVTANGNVQFTTDGKIIANAGEIAGWTMGRSAVFKDGKGMHSGSYPSDPAFWAGEVFPWDDSSWKSKTPFYVNNRGELFATKATISGTINARDGTLGDFVIARGIKSKDGKFEVDPVNKIIRNDNIRLTSSYYDPGGIKGVNSFVVSGDSGLPTTMSIDSTNYSTFNVKANGRSVSLYAGSGYSSVTADNGTYQSLNVTETTTINQLNAKNLYLQNQFSANSLFSRGTIGGTSLLIQDVFAQGSNPAIGTTGTRFHNIYLRNHPNVSSDHRQKSTIENIPPKLVSMFMELEPKQYHQDGKIHYGYIAQDVESIIFKYLSSTKKYDSVRDLNNDAKKYALLHKDVSFLSLLYQEITVIKDSYYRTKIKELDSEIKNLRAEIGI